jgi:phosphate transport system permease protein
VKVVLPAASPAVFASFVLAFGRAIGRRMILLMAGGNAAITSVSLLDPLRTLSATIAAEMGEVVVGSAHYSALFFMAHSALRDHVRQQHPRAVGDQAYAVADAGAA